MAQLDYIPSQKISLKDNPDAYEVWLHGLIREDPSIIGLGDVTVLENERRQYKAGRLDFLLHDEDEDIRYEVEVMLGPTDESHIIRCVEYWDIERRRYPGYDHCAVLIAEDITSRFLNVLGLFAGTIPLIVIQLNALSVGKHIVLDFVRVIDRAPLRRDDLIEISQPKDRDYWNKRSTPSIMKLLDEVVEEINSKCSTQMRLNYVKNYVGLTDGRRPNNFVHFNPKKQVVHLKAVIPSHEHWLERFAVLGVEARTERRKDLIRVTLNAAEFGKHRDIINELIADAVEAYEAE